MVEKIYRCDECKRALNSVCYCLSIGECKTSRDVVFVGGKNFEIITGKTDDLVENFVHHFDSHKCVVNYISRVLSNIDPYVNNAIDGGK